MTQIGSHKIASQLGEGATSTVYLGHHTETGQLAAVKLLKTFGKTLLNSIRQEIKALSCLQHPNIVTIYEEGIHQGSPFYAMELLDGQTLERWMAASVTGTMLESQTEVDSLIETQTVQPSEIEERAAIQSPPTAKKALAPGALQKILDIGRALCAPLHYLHCKGLVHLDLKPANIFIKPDLRPVIVDFGMVSRFSNETGRELLSVQIFGGTPYYMSPEQIEHADCDARSDLYSLGCILYHMIAGTPPFRGALQEVLQAHRTKPPMPLSELVEGVPPALDELILRLLVKQPRQRVGYAETLASWLETLGASRPNVETSGETYLYRTSLVGRDHSFAQLTAGLQQIRKGRLWLLGGECGSGKTRLALELAKTANKQSIEVMSGECQELNSPPLHALQQAFHLIADHCLAKGEEETRSLIGLHRQALSVLAPAFTRLPHTEEAAIQLETPQQLYQALTTLFTKFAASKPILLVLDDLQWADELLLGWLSWVAATPMSGVMIVGLYRTEELTSELRALLPLETVRRLSLEPLEPHAIQQIAAETLSTTEPPQEFCDFLQRSSEGNPLFIREHLRTAVAQRQLQRDSEGRWFLAAPLEEAGVAKAIPGALQALLWRRLQLLQERSLLVAKVASLFEEEIMVPLLSWLVSIDEALVQESLQELQQKEILRSTAAGRLRFTHEKLRSLCYEAQDPEERRALHEALATYMEQAPEESSMAILASHWERANDRKRACECYLRAAKFSAQRFAHQESVRLYRAYLALVESPNHETIVAHNALGDVLQLQGKIEEAIQEFTDALRLAERLDDTAQAAESKRLLGAIHRRIGKIPEALQLLEEALQLSRRAKAPQTEGATLNSLAGVRYERAEFNLAESLFGEALQIHQKTANKREEGMVLANLALIFFQRGDKEHARELTLRALHIAQESGNRRSEGSTYNNLAEILKAEGLHAEATDAYQNALLIAREIGNKRSEGVTLNNLSAMFYEQGELYTAQQYCLDAIKIHREVENQRSLAISLRRLAIISLWLPASPSIVEDYCAQAESIFVALGAKVELAKLYCLQGHIALCRNQSADELLLRAMQIAADKKNADLIAQQEGLARAIEADLKGDPLLNGYCYEDVPKPVRDWFEGRAIL